MNQSSMQTPNGNIYAVTNRDIILAEYTKQAIASGGPFVMKSRSYHATGSMVFLLDNTSTFPTYNATGPVLPVGGYYTAPKGQVIEWFGQQLGQTIAYGYTSPTSTTPYQHVLEDADTNLGKSRQTNGSEDMIIESISLTKKSTRVGYQVQSGSTTALNATDPLLAELPVNVSSLNTFLGQTPIRDPASLANPPQVNSPFNLEDIMMDLLCGATSIELEFNRNNVIKLGRTDQIPEGGRKGYNIAGGQPSTSNRYEVPEAYVWRHTGSPQDADFVVRGILQEDVSIPMNAVPLFGLPDNPGRLPRAVWLDITLRVHGQALSWPSQNSP